MANYKVSDFVKMYKEENPESSSLLENLDDTDIMQAVAKDQPELLEYVDRDDLALTMKEARKKTYARQRQKEFKSMAGVSRFFTGVQHGVMDTFMGISQGIRGLEQKLFSPDFGEKVAKAEESIFGYSKYKPYKEEYMEASKGDVAAGAGELAGALAVTAPIPGATGAKLAGKFASPLVKGAIKAATAAGIGAGFGAAEYVDEDETRAKNTLYGAMFGAGGAGAGMLIKKIGTKAFNALKGKMKTAKIQELYDLGKKHGIDLSKGDLTGKSGTRKAEIALESKIGGISPEREAQAKAVNQVVETTEKLFRPKDAKKPLNPSEIGKRLQESTQKGFDKARDIAKKNYNEVEKLSGGARSNPENSIREINKVLKTFGKSKTPKQNPAIKYLETLKGNLSSGKSSYSELRATREALGKDAADYARNNPTAAKMLGNVRASIEKDMDDAIEAQIESMARRKGKAMDKLAGSEIVNPFRGVEVKAEKLKQVEKAKKLKEAYEVAKKQYRDDVVPYRKSKTLKAVLNQEEPDQIFKTMLKEDYGDRAQRFYKALDEKGKETVEYGIIKAAMKDAKKVTEFGPNYSPLVFSNKLNELDEVSKLFMSPAKKKYVDGVEKVLMAAKRAGQYMENPPTGNRVEIAREIRNAKFTLGLLPLLTKGEKFFSTGKGKNFILAASELEPGSIPMQNLISKIYRDIPKISAVTGKEISE